MKQPKYTVYIRWGSFQLNIAGRLPILGWLAALASIVGFRLFL
jgi:hypothetical protein